MLCVKCGNKIEDGESFCTKCGEKVEVIQESLDTQPKKKNKKALVGISIGAAAVIVAAVVVISIFTVIHNSSMNRPFELYKKGMNTKNVEMCLDASFPKEVRKRMEKEIKARDIDVTNWEDIDDKLDDDEYELWEYCEYEYYGRQIINNKKYTLETFQITDYNLSTGSPENFKKTLKEDFDIDASAVTYVGYEECTSLGQKYETSGYIYKYKGKWYLWFDF